MNNALDTTKEFKAQVQGFSQQTRHEKIGLQTPETPTAQAISARAETANVTLISNPGMSCHAAEKIDGHILDCERLSKTDLRKRYPREASSHKNMLSRRQTNGASVHSDLVEFVSFLRIVGPMPARRATLDRIDNLDPEYAPGKVRWADKQTQNSNKSDTLIFFYSRTGQTFTTSTLAKMRGVSPATIRKQNERGWSHDEIIEGKRAVTEKVAPELARKSANHLQHLAYFSEPAPKLAKEIAFEREALRFKRHREHYEGEEAVMASYEYSIEIAPELLPEFTPEKYEKRFAKVWPIYRPHVNFDNIAKSQQALVARIDPEYYAKWKAKAKMKANVKAVL